MCFYNLLKVEGNHMNYFTKILFALLITLIILLFCSCGASHSIQEDVIYKDDSFSYNQLMNNNVANAGVFSHIVQITYDDKAQSSFLLSKVLLEKLKDVHRISMVSTGQLISEIGKENYLAIMDNIELEGILNNEDIIFIKESMPDLNYLLLAYITNEILLIIRKQSA